MCYEADSEPYAVARDARVAAALDGLAEARASPGHTLHDLALYGARFPKGQPPKTYESFRKIFDAVGAPAAPRAAPASVPPPCAGALADAAADAEWGLSLIHI